MGKKRDLIRMTDAELSAYLAGRHVLNMATVGPDERIHLVAMWYGFLGDNVAVATFERSQKVRNLERHDRITGLVESGESYEELKGAEIVGRVRIHREWDTVLAVCADVAKRYYGVDNDDDARAIAEGIARKRVAIEIIPDKIVTWDHTKLGGQY